MNKWITGIIVIVVLLLGVYFVTRTQDTTSSTASDTGASVSLTGTDDVSSEIQSVETEEIEAENALEEMGAKTF